MKKKSNLLIGLLIVLLLAIFGFTLYNGRLRVPEGKVLVDQSMVDSLNAYIAMADSLQIIANQPPDTVIVDTIYLDKPVIAETTPTIEVDPIDTTLLTVKDSLVIEGEVSAWVEFQMRGQLESGIKWKYRPIIKEQIITIKQKVPYPVIETIYVPKATFGHYLSFNAGGNDKMFIFGLDYDIVNENSIYGLRYQRFGQQNVYGAKIGIKLNTIFKRIRNGP